MSRADALISAMADEIRDGDVVATGVASPLPLLAIALARATHAPHLTYLSCVGSVDPEIGHLHGSSEDLAYLDGRTAELSIPELFDHARRGRVDVVFFGAAEVDAAGRCNMSALGPLTRPRVKLPGVAGAATLRRWVTRPVLVVPRQSRRTLVPRAQVASTEDGRPTRLLTQLGTFALSETGARLLALRPRTTPEEVVAQTGFAFARAEPLGITPPPSPDACAFLTRIDPEGHRHALVA